MPRMRGLGKLVPCEETVSRKWIVTTSVLHDCQSYITPPYHNISQSFMYIGVRTEHTQVRGMRKLVVAAMKMNDPKKSNVFRRSQTDPSLFRRRKQIGMPMAAIIQKGMLIQKIHLHVVFSANVPPMTGPSVAN